MLTVDAAKELKTISTRSRGELTQQTAIIATNRLLEYGAAEDRAILRSMGLDSNIKKLEEIRGLKVELDMLENKYKQVFTKEEIATLACKYLLKFNKTDRYKGNVDPVLLQKIKEFAKEADIELTPAHYQHRFFILAPQKAFNLDTRPIAPKPRKPDPLLFYKLDDGHYRLIHKWGNDLSMFRRVLGFYRATEGNFTWCNFGIAFTLLMISSMFFVGMQFPIAQVGISALVSLIISLAVLPSKAMKPWKDVYDTDFKD